MTTLVVGANGATGRLLVEQLLKQGEHVKIIVRSENGLSETIKNHGNITIVDASILDMSETELGLYLKGCDAVASCLGHNLTFKGMFGQPRRLVTDAVRHLCIAIAENKPEKPVKFVLMNTTANSNRDLSEPISFGQKVVTQLLRILLPPHSDNEHAADFLRVEVGQNDPVIEWVAVRPDGLIDKVSVTEYEEYPSPIRSAIFDAGKTSRINVGHFMAKLITDNNLWEKWRGRMPVIYNKESNS